MIDQDQPGTGRGLFLCLDGPDGGGKSTQVARLASWLRDLGREVVVCRDPGGTPLGERIRSILLDRSTIQPTLRAEMLLYMASRAQLVDEVIRPAVESGKIVLTDRFLLANVVYQGYGGGLPIADLWAIGRVATGGLMPDLTLLLDLPLAVAKARIGAPRDRMEDRPDEERARIRDGYLDAARTYPQPIVAIDADADPDVVLGRLKSEVERVLAIGPRS